ncbi:MAG: DPP IV N-terminal domain-containing protein, partial [Prevotella sp.]|nr:DPP IV N-terminal domain-containing protein [Prevotella sp.]
MKKIIIMCAILFSVAGNAMAENGLSLKDITDSKYSAETLGAVTPLADGESYAMMSDDGKKLYKYSFKTGKQSDVLFDVGNTVGCKIDKFDNYIMSPDETKMLIQTETKKIYRHSFTAVYYIYNIAEKKLEKLSDYGPQQSPVWSPDGRMVAFVRENNIYLVKLIYNNAELQVTKDGERNEVINGVPDWVNEEEFSFNSALIFNADNTMLCWIRYDESNVKTYTLDLFKGMSPENSEYAEYPGSYTYKYPKAGQVNSSVSVMSYDIQSKQIRTMQLDLEQGGYIPRIKATSDAQSIIVYTMNRHQDQLCLYSVNPRSTLGKLLIKESVPKYVKSEAMENIKITSGNILLPSDRSGYMQLYLYTLTGQLVRQVTNTQYDITDVYGYDEQTGNVYYQAAGNNPLNREIYVAYKNGKTECLTSREGWNEAIFSKGLKYYINVWSDRNTPYEYSVCATGGKTATTLIDNQALKNNLNRCGLSDKEFFSFKTSEGTELNG